MTTRGCQSVGQCTCPKGACACSNCHGGVDKNQGCCQDSQGNQKCNCSSTSDCTCEKGKCACASCGKPKEEDAAGKQKCACSSTSDCKCEPGKCTCASCGSKQQAAL
ncbi:hypothetical protein JCM10207_002848 [Rhodosporidiobolus poonsookiae]